MHKRMQAPLFCLLAAVTACSQPGVQNNSAENGAIPDPAANVAAETGNAAANVATTAPGPASTPTTATTTAAPYHASGSEPFWALEIAGGHMAYTSADGPNVTEPLPVQQPVTNGYKYQGNQLVVVVTHSSCQEASGQNQPDTVNVTVAGQTVSGCGG